MKKVILTVILILLLSSCTKIESYDVHLNEGQDVINSGETWIDNGCDITINGKLSAMELTNTLDNTSPGEYELVYDFSFGGEEFTCIRVVKVLDSGYPMVELNAGLDTIYIGETHVDAGITIVDDQEQDCVVVVSNNVKTSRIGSYSITYEVTDYDGNQTTIIRMVTVVTK